MTGKLKRFFIYTMNIPLYYISKLIRKDPNIWIFGAWHGEKYADNSKFLFEYVNKKHPNISAIWLSNNNKVIALVRSKGYMCHYTYSLKAIALSLKAGYSIFVQANFYDCMPFLNNGKTKIIQLFHGIPLKRIGYDDTLQTFNVSQSGLKSILFPFLTENENYDLLIACSNEDKNNFMSSFNNENVMITGYPRNDILIRSTKDHDELNIIYAPTFRGDVGSHTDLITNYGFNFDKWIEYINTNKIVFYIKMHPLNQPPAEIINAFSHAPNINLVGNVDIAELLPEMDILITDYSSVYFDYLLTDKPIIYAPFDHETYITKDRELYYEYSDVTPGPKCKDWNEVLNWIKRFKDDPSLFSDKRKSMKNQFHKYQDNKSCERVFNQILMLENHER